jgi:hypothetical protein
MLRTLSIAGTFAVATSLSARAGPAAAAAHQVRGRAPRRAALTQQ